MEDDNARVEGLGFGPDIGHNLENIPADIEDGFDNHEFVDAFQAGRDIPFVLPAFMRRPAAPC